MATQNNINHASSQLTIDPGASGDSFVQFDINATGEFRIGVDDTDSDSFKISQGSALGTNDTFVMSSAGIRTLPLQTAFLAVPSSTLSNVTGDATIYTPIIFGTESLDIGSNYNAATGVFTAPVAGKYKFCMGLSLTGISTSMTNDFMSFNVNSGGTSHITFQITNANGIAPSGALSLTGSVVISLAASDTVSGYLRFIGGSKTVDITTDSFFGGFLVA